MKSSLKFQSRISKGLSFSILLVCLFICQNVLIAQEENGDSKIGLVLSGGGAKGFAHIGVLKVIDSLGIKIDYVAGTSMGAIIGSLYATGYTGKQLEEMFESQDFDILINDRFSRDSKSFYERENADKYAVNLPFDNFKISLPSALSRGQNVYNLLQHLMMPVNDVRDFSKLPIPFFCIATDIETGQSIIMDKGRLPEAVAASGALPSLFQPVTINGRILIDGGVTNNFPVEELRAKGMDIIIGVDVQDGLKDREELASAADILLQINNFRTINAMKDKAPLTDIYIKPDIKNFSVISFDEGADIIENGEKAAKENLQLLLVKNKQEDKSFINEGVKLPDSLVIKSINIDGNERYTRSYILGKLKLKGDQRICYDDLKKGINNLIATDNFDTFRYCLEPAGENFDLSGKIKESESTMFLRFGLHYDGLYKSALIANLTKKRLLFDNDIASLDVILGDHSRYNFDYFIDKGYYISIGLKSRYNKFEKNISPFVIPEEDEAFDGINKISVKYQDFTNQLYLQTIFRKDFALRAGVEHKRLKITSETLFSEDQSGDIVFENTDYFSLFGNLKFDSYSDSNFAKRGFYFDGVFHLYVNGSGFNRDFEEFSIAKADIGYAFSLSKKVAVRIESNGGFTIGDKSTSSLNFGLGGYGSNFINNFYSFYGYDYVDIIANSFVKTNLTLDYELFKKHHIILAANIANVEDELFETGNWFSSPDYTGYALGYSLETFLGPIEGKYTYSPETGNSYWFFNLGFWF